MFRTSGCSSRYRPSFIYIDSEESLTEQLRLSVCSFLVHLKLAEHVKIVRHTSCDEWNDTTCLAMFVRLFVCTCRSGIQYLFRSESVIMMPNRYRRKYPFSLNSRLYIPAVCFAPILSSRTYKFRTFNDSNLPKCYAVCIDYIYIYIRVYIYIWKDLLHPSFWLSRVVTLFSKYSENGGMNATCFTETFGV